MTRVFDPPVHVLESQAARDRATAARRSRSCVYDGCAQQVFAARGGGAARCREHDAAEFTPPPIPDPCRTLSALRNRLKET